MLDHDLGVQVDAIEITQGIQTPEVPTRTGLGEHVSYQGVPSVERRSADGQAAADHTTVVRVYATAASRSAGTRCRRCS